MPRTRLNENFCQDVLALFPRLNLQDFTEVDQVLETDDYRIRVHWFLATTMFPDPLLEVVATKKKPQGREKSRAYIYRSGTGNDIHPEFGTSGWRFHMV
jgi:hypothetical protein